MRRLIAQRMRELEERKKTLQARLDKQERAQSTRGKMLLEWFVLEQLERNEQCGHREDLRQCADVRGRAGGHLAATVGQNAFVNSPSEPQCCALSATVLRPQYLRLGKKTESEIQPEIKYH
ncbi:hypothetical protein FB593_1058 [Rhizobium sp. SJZ105]|uniref:hypothetical protein n=1 Tax=Rhizobium sp. SJZ105 TaxID=2572678 RepID=UPI0011A9330D|nr:hypothetical protein [Rhizobium sp. SJZ105]TWC81418.1 hypothetical protein FB593_1058 [Rhizobium sp. SJZ105]